jgi:hypothetical protein
MRYHYCEGDAGYCDCGRYVKAECRGFGPQTHFVYLDSDNNETCE